MCVWLQNVVLSASTDVCKFTLFLLINLRMLEKTLIKQKFWLKTVAKPTSAYLLSIRFLCC